MKKNFGKMMAGLLALGLVFVFAGCVNPSESKLNAGYDLPSWAGGGNGGNGGDPGLTVTGLGDYNGKWAVVPFLDINAAMVAAADNVISVSSTSLNFTFSKISGGKVTLPLWDVDINPPSITISQWEGSGTAPNVSLSIMGTSSGDQDSIVSSAIATLSLGNITFTNGSGSASYSNGGGGDDILGTWTDTANNISVILTGGKTSGQIDISGSGVQNTQIYGDWHLNGSAFDFTTADAGDTAHYATTNGVYDGSKITVDVTFDYVDGDSNPVDGNVTWNLTKSN
jgi:hypothetical protein